MFIGHFALGFAAKRAAPETSLGTLFLAAQFVDLLWPTLLLLGVERVEIDPALSGAPLVFVHYPISHSLLGALGWGALLGAAYFAVTRQRRGACGGGLARRQPLGARPAGASTGPAVAVCRWSDAGVGTLEYAGCGAGP